MTLWAFNQGSGVMSSWNTRFSVKKAKNYSFTIIVLLYIFGRYDFPQKIKLFLQVFIDLPDCLICMLQIRFDQGVWFDWIVFDLLLSVLAFSDES